MELDIAKTNQKFLPGVAILRFYLAFMVVCFHFGGKAIIPVGWLFYFFQAFHVSSFIFLSFVLCGNYFFNPTKEGILKRIIRIIFPLVFWGTIAWLLYIPLFGVIIPSTVPNILLFFVLCNNSLWFLLILLVISILLWLLRLIPSKKVFIGILIGLFVLSILLQYLGWNYELFSNSPPIIKLSFGRLFEMLPYACGGLLFSLFLPKLLDYSKKNKIIIFIISLLLLIIIQVIYLQIGFYNPDGYGYQGLYLLLGGLLLVLSSFVNPINFVKNAKALSIIKVITSFTLGIFCIHSIVGLYIELAWVQWGFEAHNFLVSLLIYLVSYVVCFLIYLIPCKYTKLLVE